MKDVRSASLVSFLSIFSCQREFYVTKEKLRPLNPSASAKLLWGLAKTEVAFADDFDRECLEAVAADMSSKILSFSPRVGQSSDMSFELTRENPQRLMTRSTVAMGEGCVWKYIWIYIQTFKRCTERVPLEYQ